MALVSRCPKCKIEKVIDTHCGYCFDCLNQFADLKHKASCPVAKKEAKIRAKNIIYLHDLIEEQIKIQKKASQQIGVLMFVLQTIDSCPHCHGQRCSACDRTGYKKITKKLIEIAEAPDPPPTC